METYDLRRLKTKLLKKERGSRVEIKTTSSGSSPQIVDGGFDNLTLESMERGFNDLVNDLV